MTDSTKLDPVDNVQWVHFSALKANHYNPNYVMSPELKLLERNMIRVGWMQPLVVDTEWTIIDGFHRWQLAQRSKELLKVYKGQVPIVVLKVEPWEAICLTVRINRAKGTHAAVKMADLVIELIDKHGVTPEQIEIEMGMPKREVELLYENSIFVSRGLDKAPYSKAWIPKENKPRAKKK